MIPEQTIGRTVLQRRHFEENFDQRSLVEGHLNIERVFGAYGRVRHEFHKEMGRRRDSVHKSEDQKKNRPIICYLLIESTGSYLVCSLKMYISKVELF